MHVSASAIGLFTLTSLPSGVTYPWAVPISSFFAVDYVGSVFSVLSLLVSVSMVFFIGRSSDLTIFFVLLSTLSSIVCYNTVNSFIFWVSYELSILFLMFVLINDSPYPERYVAFWYFLGYIIFSSLPMFLCILFISSVSGSFNLLHQSLHSHQPSVVFCFFFLGLLFITKIPLFPFHSWLPIVHAESSSPVSVCLSGYVMKLGVLGLYRFCSVILPDYLFCSVYIVVVMSVSLLFLLCSCLELDGKRWLAYLSLSHISISCLGACVCDYSLVGLPWYFCLGHGLSAGCSFVLLWLYNDLCGSRNWLILKGSLFNSSIVSLFTVFSLLTVASAPTTVTFFCEFLVFGECLVYNVYLSLVMFIYLFLSGLIPLVTISHLFSCSTSVSIISGRCWCYFCSLLFSLFWLFFLFLLI